MKFIIFVFFFVSALAFAYAYEVTESDETSSQLSKIYTSFQNEITKDALDQLDSLFDSQYSLFQSTTEESTNKDKKDKKNKTKERRFFFKNPLGLLI